MATSITLSAISNDGFVNASEAGLPLVVGGTVSGVVGTPELWVNFNGQWYQGKVSANGATWAATIPASVLAGLADGSYSISADLYQAPGKGVGAHTTAVAP